MRSAHKSLTQNKRVARLFIYDLLFASKNNENQQNLLILVKNKAYTGFQLLFILIPDAEINRSLNGVFLKDAN